MMAFAWFEYLMHWVAIYAAILPAANVIYDLFEGARNDNI